MNRFVLILVTFLLIECSANYEPKFSGKAIHYDWSSDVLKFNINGELTETKLPTNDTVDFDSPLWLAGKDFVLMTMKVKLKGCYTHSVVALSQDGKILETVYEPKPCQIIDFMPSPDGKRLLIRTFNYEDWNSKQKRGNIKYLVYDISTKSIQDSVVFEQAKLDLEKFHETIWRPDSERALVFVSGEGDTQEAFIFNLKGHADKLAKGTNFVWSPKEQDLVSYLADNEILFKNVETGEVTVFYQGQDNKRINDFRWSPTGDYLVINFNGHSLNVDSKATWRPTSIMVSTVNRLESREFEGHNVFDSWN